MRATVLARLATLTIGMLGPLALPSDASDVMTLTWRKAQIMSFGDGVGTIIIGDPKVIDVTLEGGGQVVVFGKVPGETNMMVLGADKSVLFDAVVVVMPEDDRQVSIISPGSNVISERSWTCLTRCVQVLGPGGTPYASVAGASGTYSKLGEARDQADAQYKADYPGAAAGEAAGQVRQDVGDANAETARRATGFGGERGTTIVPY